MRRTKKILVAPLNWGLGHATRCIPIIRELQRLGAEVLLASDGRALNLLRKEFPELPALELPPYGIEYRSDNIVLNVGREVPHLIHAISRENKSMHAFIRKYRIDGVISDNRMGCYSRLVPCVFITHQINLILPHPVLEKISRRINYWFISKFDECWVPDVAEEPSLSGALSHNTPVEKVKFIGALSRMKRCRPSKKYDVIAVLSGPEPQRTYLEKKIIEQARYIPKQFLVVQGIPEKDDHFFPAKNVEVISCLTSEALNQAILESDVYVGRTGYSSLMDLAQLGKPALLIPTPGQTEQEYLAEKLAVNGIFHTQTQKALQLAEGLEIAQQRGGLEDRYFSEDLIRVAIEDFLNKCK